MDKDISSQYTKTCNQKYGRRGYCGWKEENAVSSPYEYGAFVVAKKRKSKKVVPDLAHFLG